MEQEKEDLKQDVLDLMKERLSDREIWIVGEIDNTIVFRATSHVQKWNIQDEAVIEPQPIKVFIHSPGGESLATTGLIALLQSAKAEVQTYNLGECCSAATYIYLTGKKRFAPKNSVFMFHAAYAGGGCQKVNDLQAYTDFIVREQNRADELVLKQTKVTKQEVEEYVKRDLWLFGDEAMEKGIVTHLL